MKILFVTAPAQLNGFMQRLPHTFMADNAQLDLAIVGVFDDNEYNTLRIVGALKMPSGKFDAIKGLAYRNDGEVVLNPPRPSLVRFKRLARWRAPPAQRSKVAITIGFSPATFADLNPPKRNQELFAKAYSAFKTGRYLVVNDFVPNEEERTEPAFALGFRLHPDTHSRGECWTLSQEGEWMNTPGFGNRDAWQYPSDFARYNADPNQKATVTRRSHRPMNHCGCCDGSVIFGPSQASEVPVLQHRLDSLMPKC